jgi:hypothetical protein
MSAKFFPVVPDYIRGWYNLRAERKAMLKATEEMSKSPDSVLDDMGILRDDVTYAFQDHRNWKKRSIERLLRDDARSQPKPGRPPHN